MPNLTDPELVKGTTPAVDAVDHINFIHHDLLTEDGSGDGEGFRLLRIALNGSTSVIVEGRVPELDGSRTWKATVHFDIQQSPPVPITPVVELVAPDEVSPNDRITLQGEHLPASIGDCHVTVGGIDAEVIFSSSLEVVALCPVGLDAELAGEPIKHFVVVEDLSTGLSTGVIAEPDDPAHPEIVVYIIQPTISTGAGLDPLHGRVSAEVTVTGVGFSSDPTLDAVTFDSAAPVFPAEAGTEQLKVNVPPDAATGKIMISVGGVDSLLSAQTFTRDDHSVGAPFPNHGPVGATVNISGSDLSDVTADYVVTFGSDTNPAVVLTASSGTLEVQVPPTAVTGTIDVAIGPASDPSGTFTRDDHAITSLSVSTGPVTTPVTVNGTNFSVIPANNVVKFNGTTASVTASTTTTLTTSVPVGATSGAVTVDIGPVSDSGPTFTVT